MNILFVCTANISRSFLAEKLFKHEIDSLHINGITVSSAGVFAFPGSPPDPKMVDYLEKMGIDPGKHQSRQLEETNVQWADIIMVMEKQHQERIETLYPESKNKVTLLGKYVSADQSEDDIVDPYGRSSFYYRSVQSQISLALNNLIQSVVMDR